MSEECTHKCEGCEQDCADRKETDFREAPHELSQIKKVIGIVSGKGGVGKTLVTSLLAVMMQRSGYDTGILDADITGPSVPKTFGVYGRVAGSEMGIFPAKSKTGIGIMSVNLLLENDTDPVVWRGPIIAGTVKQFWTDVIWGDLDFLFVDMPPGTGDVPLTVFQSLPVDGIIIVTSPQELVSMIVGKAVKMAQMMNIPILGLVENMSYALCPDCGKKLHIFGESHIAETAQQYGISAMDSMPVNPELAALCDSGDIEACESNPLENLVEALKNML